MALTDSETFFLGKVNDGTIVIDAMRGTCFNTKTNRYVGATSSTGRYPKYSMAENGRGSRIHHIQLHRLVWIIHNGPIIEGNEINHINCKREDYSLSNLEMITPKQNMAHAVANGLLIHCKGINNGNAKFNQLQIDDIRRWHSEGTSVGIIADEMNCCPTTIRDIVNYRSYK